MTNKKSTGFTLIELLVVVAIIGLLSSIITVSINTSRTKARDARRISDLKQIKAGLDLYFQTGSGYPAQAVWDATVGASLQCSGTPVLQIPRDPIDPTYRYTYTNPAGTTTYSGCGTTVSSGYELEFYIEKKGLYYIINEDGRVREKVSGNSVSLDSLL